MERLNFNPSIPLILNCSSLDFKVYLLIAIEMKCIEFNGGSIYDTFWCEPGTGRQAAYGSCFLVFLSIIFIRSCFIIYGDSTVGEEPGKEQE